MFGFQLVMILLFLLIGWAILKKEVYWLISNFRGRPEAERQEMIENGYPQRVGKLMLATGAGMALLFPLAFTSFKYAMEIQFGFLLVFLLGGLIYLSKYEVKAKRKRSYIISSTIAVFTVGFITVLLFFGYQDFKMEFHESSFEISGMYGDKWDYEDIQEVQLLEAMPRVTLKQNGIGLTSMAKGKFKVVDYGSSLLFIHKGYSPYLYIKLEDGQIFINSKDPELVKEWYHMLEGKQKE